MKTLAPVHPNAGIEAAYRKQLDKLIEQMHKSVMHWVIQKYKANTPEMAMDASPAMEMRVLLKQLSRYWIKKFKDHAPELAKKFTDKNAKYVDKSMMDSLKKSGFTVNFKTSAAFNDIAQATISANVSLIQSIAPQYLTQVEGMVMRSVQTGRDVGGLSRELQEQLGVTRRRAQRISLDQNNKATAVINRLRQEEAGITQAVWVHNAREENGRPEHVKWGKEKKVYDVAVGMWSEVDQQYVWPGACVNCLPGGSEIEFSAGCKKLWRRRFTGELTEIVTVSGKVLRATPNHPILTDRGWIRIDAINAGDNVIGVSQQVLDLIENDPKSRNTTFAELFSSIARYIEPIVLKTSAAEFHGDVTDEEVDTIDVQGFLPSKLNVSECKEFAEFFFPRAEKVLIACGFFNTDSALYSTLRTLFRPPHSVISGFSALLPLFKSGLSGTDETSFRLATELNSLALQAASNNIAAATVFFGEGENTSAFDIFSCDNLIGKMFGVLSLAVVAWDCNTPSADILGDERGINTNYFGNLLDIKPGSHEFDCVVDTRRVSFSNHVYNLESNVDWYSSNKLIIHNCKCRSHSIIPGLNYHNR